MNKRSLYLALVIGTIACNNKKEGNSFIVDGKVKNNTAKLVYLQESQANAQPVIIDSAQVAKDGSFELTGTGKQEAIYTLRSNESPYPFAILINDSKKITVNVDPMNQQEPYTVKGSPASQGIIDYDKSSMQGAKKVYDLSKHIDSLVKAKAPDSVTKAPFTEYEAAATDLRNYTYSFIEKANDPVLILYALGGYQRLANALGLKEFSKLEVGDIINKAAAKFPNSTALNELKKSQPSSVAPDFSLPDTTGKPVALSSFKGKYVLVDFWASWCRPCRAENPNVVKAYNQFKDKNFTILGVSLDKTKEAWMQAIKDDGLTWNHVSDLKFWDNAAAALYDVRSIPYNILIDPNGKIIAEDLRGSDLENTLTKVLK